MSKESTYKIRVGKKLIPVSKRLYLYYYRSRRRLKYYEHDIKIDIAVRDSDGDIVDFIPSKEDSLNQIVEAGSDFPETECIEDLVVNKLMIEKLRICLSLLSEDERRLIYALFYSRKSETDAGKLFNITQQAVSKRRTKILIRLQKLLEN